AVKVLHQDVAQDTGRLSRFEREAKAVAKLDHPNILAIHDFGAEEGITYAVTELLDGQSLRQSIPPAGMPWQKAVEMGAAIARGLAAAHGKGIVHRDLKPDNVFVTSDGRAKILDFGLAQVKEPVEEDAETAILTPAGTIPGSILGTMGYMSPEQLRGEPVDARSDIFALGCVLYEMLTGQAAFVRKSIAETSAAVLKEEPERLSSTGTGLPAEVERSIHRCLEKSPEARFQSAQDLSFALQQVAWADFPARGAKNRQTADGQARPSIAVLPFGNLSADPEQEYFCDGMAEEIINALAHVDGLRVVARTSSFAFKGKSQDIRQIGNALGVQSLLEGSVRKAGDRLRITAQLIDVRDGSHQWSERFDRRLEDVFEIQDEIAVAIVERLEVRLLGGERAAVFKRHTDNLKAHNAFLEGLFEWNKMSPEGFVRCQELYRNAIDLDPNFAPAYMRLADSYTSVTWWSDQPPANALAAARPLVEKALTLDPDLALAHCVIGQIKSFFERDRIAGERSMRRAVDLAPNDAYAQISLALVLVMGGQQAEGAERARTALVLDPLSPTNTVWAGAALLISGHRDEGLAVIRRQVTMTPHLWMAQYWLSHGLAIGGRFDEGREPAERALKLSGASSLTLCNLALICYRLGDSNTADELFGRLCKRAESGYVSPMFLSWLHLSRGEQQLALRRAAEALEAKDPWVVPHRTMSPAIVPADPLVDDLLPGALP
ncbi:MAG: protein kinase, partial [Acidobacteriota bacterium]